MKAKFLAQETNQEQVRKEPLLVLFIVVLQQDADAILCVDVGGQIFRLKKSHVWKSMRLNQKKKYLLCKYITSPFRFLSIYLGVRDLCIRDRWMRCDIYWPVCLCTSSMYVFYCFFFFWTGIRIGFATSRPTCGTLKSGFSLEALPGSAGYEGTLSFMGFQSYRILKHSTRFLLRQCFVFFFLFCVQEAVVINVTFQYDFTLYRMDSDHMTIIRHGYVRCK